MRCRRLIHEPTQAQCCTGLLLLKCPPDAPVSPLSHLQGSSQVIRQTDNTIPAPEACSVSMEIHDAGYFYGHYFDNLLL